MIQRLTATKKSTPLHARYKGRPDIHCTLCYKCVDRCRCTEDDWISEIDGYTPAPIDWREHDRPRSSGSAVIAEEAELKWRHSHWTERRNKVAEAMWDAKIGGNRFWSFCNCGALCVVQWSEKLQRHRVKGSFCKDRHCEPCQRAKAARIRQNIEKQLMTRESSSPRNKRTHRFVTFTVKHSNAPLREQIDRLYACFKRLRRTPCWAESQTGGVCMLEVKLSNGEWHPHLHVVVGGNWVHQDELREAWKEVTGDSFIVHIRALPRINDIGAYVAKYITKGTSVEVWQDPGRAAEWIKASKGVRMCNTFGDWRSLKLTAALESATDWTFVDRLETLIGRSRSGEDHAMHVLMSMRPPGNEAEEQLTQQ